MRVLRVIWDVADVSYKSYATLYPQQLGFTQTNGADRGVWSAVWLVLMDG